LGAETPNRPFALGGIGLDQATGYLYTSRYFGGAIQIFEPQIVPDVDIQPATGVTTDSASLTGHIDTGGAGDVTSCHFEVIAEGEYLSNATNGDSWASATQVPCGTGQPGPPFNGPTDVSAEIGGLKPGHTYRLRLVAGNAEGINVDIAPSIITKGEYDFASAFGAPGAGDGQLSEPRDIAVDHGTGDVYVADTGNHRIVKFNAAGNFVATWGWGVGDGTATGQVCTAGCQAGISGSGPGQFQSPRYVEVDNSGGPSAHSVYVADQADGTVQKFTPAGALVTDWGDGGSIDLSHGGPILGMTASNEGDLFVATYLYVFPTAHYLWTQIGQDGVSRIPIDAAAIALASPGGGGIEIGSTGGFYAAEEPNGSGGVMYKHPNGRQTSWVDLYPLVYSSSLSNTGLALDRQTNDLYVAQKTHIDQIRPHVGCVEASTPTGQPQNACEPDDTFGYGYLTEASGLAFAPQTRAVYAADAGADRIAVFDPVPAPLVTTGKATAADGTAQMAGHVDPATAGPVSGCRFEYGTDLTYGGGALNCTPATPFGAPTDVSASLSGLQPLVTYHYRLVAEGSNGWPSYGEDRTFTVSGPPPSVEGARAIDIRPTSASLDAEVNPRMSSTIFHFQYGTTAGYGSATAPGEPLPGDATNHTVSSGIAGLEPETTYHFRVVAISFNGTTAGPDQTFVTAAAANVAAPPAVSETRSSTVTPAPPTTPQCGHGSASRKGICRKRHKKRPHRHGHGHGKKRGHHHA
jgi:DNA-binding beta-propeller fold protein YncE